MKKINFLKLSIILVLTLGLSNLWGQTVTLNYTGAIQNYTVPAGVTSIQIEVWGAEGGTGGGGTPAKGLGGYAIGNLSVTPGDVLNIYVGGQGTTSGPGGFNGGGQAGSNYGAAGGGASDVRISPYTLTERVIVAGGAGGSEFGSTPSIGGAGGGLIGIAGQSNGGYTGGGGGTQVAGGIAGCCYGTTIAGSFGAGGGTGAYHNAGGGGGWYGGGSGAAYGAAGGGSSYIGGVTSGVTTAGVQAGNGQVVITVLCDGLTASASVVSLCDGDLLTLTATSSNGGTITWDNGATNGVAFVPLTTGVITYTATSSSILDCSFTVDVTVNTLPSVIANVDDNDICLGDAIVFTGTGSATYAWDNGVTNGVSFVPGAAGNATYNVTGTDANGCTNTSSVDANVNALPNVVASVDDNDVCLGDAIVFTGSGASTYVWDNAVTDGASFTPGSIGNVTYNVTGTDANGCINTSSIAANVNALPNVTSSVDDNDICLGDAIVFTGSGASTYAWDNGVTNGASFLPGSVGNVMYNVTGTDANGCINTSSVAANVNALPNVVASVGDNDICLGDAIVFTGAGAVTYAWDNGVTDGASFVPGSTGNVTYNATGTDANGCTNTSSVDANVNALPNVVAAVDDNDVCLGDAIVFTGSGASTYLWDNSVTDGASTVPATIGSITYNVVGTDANGCVNNSSVAANVNALPNVTSSVDDNDICIGDAIIFIGAGAVTYAWDNGVTDGTLFTPGSIGNITYNVTGTDANGCVNTSSVDANVNSIPSVIASVDDNDICLGDAIIFTGAGASTYAWDNGVTDGASFVPGAAGNVTYNVTGTDANGCTNTSSVDANVNALPNVVAAVDDNDVCLGDAIVFTGAGASTYVWDNAVTDGSSFTPVAIGNATYNVTGTDANGCINTSSVDANLNALPNVTSSVDDNDICLGDSVLFTGSGATTYAWDNNVTDGVFFSPGSVGNITYNVIGTDVNGCTNTSNVDVNVNAIPAVVASVDFNDICLGDTVIFTGSGASTYLWDNGVTEGALFSPAVSGSITYTVTGSDASGCSNTSSVDVMVNEVIITYVSSDEMFGNDGSIDITVTGGTNTYVFDWDNDGTSDFDDSEDLTGLAGGTYTVVAVDDNGCEATEVIIVNSQLGITNGNDIQIEVYPNPTANNVTIQLEGNFTYELMTMSGKIIINGTGMDTQSIEMENLSSGTYLIHIVSNNSNKVVKIFKQ